MKQNPTPQQEVEIKKNVEVLNKQLEEIIGKTGDGLYSKYNKSQGKDISKEELDQIKIQSKEKIALALTKYMSSLDMPLLLVFNENAKKFNFEVTPKASIDGDQENTQKLTISEDDKNTFNKLEEELTSSFESLSEACDKGVDNMYNDLKMYGAIKGDSKLGYKAKILKTCGVIITTIGLTIAATLPAFSLIGIKTVSAPASLMSSTALLGSLCVAGGIATVGAVVIGIGCFKQNKSLKGGAHSAKNTIASLVNIAKEASDAIDKIINKKDEKTNDKNEEIAIV